MKRFEVKEENEKIEKLKNIVFNEILKLDDMQDGFKDEIFKANTIKNSIEIYLKSCNMQMQIDKVISQLRNK